MCTLRERALKVQRTTTYREQSRVFLSQAHEELAKGDLQQASEKGVGRGIADGQGHCPGAGVAAPEPSSPAWGHQRT